MTFRIVQGDTAPPISSTLTDNGVPVELDNVSNIEFYLENKFEQIIVSADLTGRVNIVDDSAGKVEYTWRSGDTDNIGTHYAQWQVLYDDGKTETFPSDKKIRIEITEAIQ